MIIVHQAVASIGVGRCPGPIPVLASASVWSTVFDNPAKKNGGDSSYAITLGAPHGAAPASCFKAFVQGLCRRKTSQ
jgi:hypothetical protein